MDTVTPNVEDPKDKLPPYSIGLVWDDYTPAVEGQLLRDILALQVEAGHHKMKLQVVCTSNAADRLLASLKVIRTSLVAIPEVWRAYKTKAGNVEMPEGVPWCEPIVCDLYQKKATENALQEGGNNGYNLPDQGRANTYDPYNRPSPTNRSGYSTQNPLINYVWSL